MATKRLVMAGKINKAEDTRGPEFSASVEVYLTSQQKALLVAAAKTMGLSLSAYLRVSALAAAQKGD